MQKEEEEVIDPADIELSDEQWVRMKPGTKLLLESHAKSLGEVKSWKAEVLDKCITVEDFQEARRILDQIQKRNDEIIVDAAKQTVRSLMSLNPQ